MGRIITECPDAKRCLIFNELICTDKVRHNECSGPLLLQDSICNE